MLKSGVEYIYEVYKEKSFSRAAEKLYVTQPTLSAAIRKEEQRWGCVFFDRSKNPVELTIAGQYFIAAIEHMKETQTDMEAHLNFLAAGKKQSVNVGAPAFFCNQVLPMIVKRFKELHPDCKINIIEASDKDLFAGMKSNVIDCCVSVEKGPQNMNSIPLTQESIILAVPSSYPVNEKLIPYQLTKASLKNKWALRQNCQKVSINEFSEYPFLLLNKGNDMYNRTHKIFRQRGISPNIFMTVEQLMTAYHMAAAGMGITLIRANLVKYTNKNLCFYALDSKYTTRNINLIYRRQENVSVSLDVFIQKLKEDFK